MGAAAVGLAALSALIWGSADYCGGHASRRMSAFTAAFAAEIAGLPVLGVGLLLVPGTFRWTDFGWGAGAGVAGYLGIVLLYRSLATGAVVLAAPISAVTGALLPVAYGLATQGLPSTLALVGVGCAIAAIALVSLGHHAPEPSATGPAVGTTRTGHHAAVIVGMALLAGALFGMFFILIDHTAGDSGLWPIAATRLGSLPFAAALVLARREPLRPPRASRWWVAGSGTGDVLANVLYLLALRAGQLSVVAPVAALYPVSTVLLAMFVDRERARVVQLAGLGLAASALILTAL